MGLPSMRSLPLYLVCYRWETGLGLRNHQEMTPGIELSPKNTEKNKQIIGVISANTIKVNGDITVDISQFKKVCPPRS